MSLLNDREFILYSLRKSYLEEIQDGVGERVIHIDHELYSRAWRINSTHRQKILGVSQPPAFNSEFQYSPPIPNFVESDRVDSSTSESPSQEPQDNGLSFHELAEAMDGVSQKTRRKNRNGKAHRLRDDSSESDFGDDESDSEENGYSDDIEDSERASAQDDGVDTLDAAGDEENDEMHIEELQRAARQIKFSKMPARAKDLIPDVDQMLSTYIQTNNRKSMHKKQHSGETGAVQSADIGLAGNSEGKEGITFLQSSSFRRAVSFDKRYNPVWSEISMDDSVMEEEGLDAEEQVSPSSTAHAHSAPTEVPNLHRVHSSASSSPGPSSLIGSASSRDLARIAVQVVNVSNLTALIKLSQTSEKNPFEIYTSASGVGELKPLRLKVYRPTSNTPTVPFEVVVKPYVTVADTIGYSLYRYWEEGRQPALTDDLLDVNKWTLRIVEDDGEPDRDFPALDRTRIISAFSFDEFALVEATQAQIIQNQKSEVRRS